MCYTNIVIEHTTTTTKLGDKKMIKEIMKKAWAMYKEAGCTLKAEFAVALKAAWAAAKTGATVAKVDLVALGGKLWEKAGKSRVYFNAKTLLDMHGFRLDGRNMDKIAVRVRNANPCNLPKDTKVWGSNSDEAKIIAGLDSVYFDNDANKFVFRQQKTYVETVEQTSEYVDIMWTYDNFINKTITAFINYLDQSAEIEAM